MKFLPSASFLTGACPEIYLDRKPFSNNSALVLDYCQKNRLSGFVAWHSISNFYYFVSPKISKNDSKLFIDGLLDFVKIPLTSTKDLKFALRLKMGDFEDAMQVAAAVACKAEAIVTRNTKDFANSPIPADSPEAVIQNLGTLS